MKHGEGKSLVASGCGLDGAFYSERGLFAARKRPVEAPGGETSSVQGAFKIKAGYSL